MNYTENSIYRKSIIEPELISYCIRKWPIHPLNGKVPILKNWQNNASTDSDIVLKWFTKWPKANVGIVTGLVSNLLVLDVDGLEGANSIVDFAMPEAPTVATARGYHYYFRFPTELQTIPTTRTRLFPGIDTRGRGGFIVAPPSIHESEHRYTWLKPLREALPEAPVWLIQKLKLNHKSRNKIPSIVKYEKHSHYAHAALRNESEAVARAPKGTRNTRLNQAAFSMGTLIDTCGMNIEYVTESLTLAAISAGLLQEEINKTLSSGLTAGMKKPRGINHG